MAICFNPSCLSDLRPARPRRVLYLQPSVDVGGAERQASLVLPLLGPLGWEVTAFAGPGRDVIDWFQHGGLVRFRWSRHFPNNEPFRFRRAPTFVRHGLRLLEELDAQHRVRPFDVVIGSLGYAWVVGGAWARRWGVPVLWRAGGLSLGESADTDSAQAVAIRTMARLLQPRLLVCNALAVARYWQEMLGLTPRVVHNGVALPSVALPPSRSQAVLRLGFAGRLAPEKNLPLLLEAVSIARRRGVPLHLSIAGPGDARPVLDQVRALGLERHVELLGRVSDMDAFYERLDAFVLPSRTEGSPNVLLEAMGHARPVVATRVGGTPELVRDGLDGLLVPSQSSWELAEALELLHSDPLQRERLGRAARRRAECFSPERSARALASVLDEVVVGEAATAPPPPAVWRAALPVASSSTSRTPW